ncbi:MAG: hypothetical protein C4523_01565 [Myxococcales bacterium]|nr:MAG: hypothetical protein C4523_01565 [Myxococcales bacterium]
MRANCWKCGSGFRFDEAKVGKRALVRCPICKARILLQQDPNSPEPRYFITAYDKQPEIKKADFEIDYSKTAPPSPSFAESAPATATPAPSSEARHTPATLPEMVALDELLDPSKAPGAPRPSSARQTLDALLAEPATKENAATRPQTVSPPPPNQVSTTDGKPAQQQAASVSQTTRPELAIATMYHPSTTSGTLSALRPPVRKTSARTFGLVVVLIAAAMFATIYFLPNLTKQLFGRAGDLAVPNRGLAGQHVLGALAKQYGIAPGDPLQLTKSAELAFQEDTEAGYQEALLLFRQSLLLDTDNAELIVRFVESTLLVHGRPEGMAKIQELSDLLDYGFTLEPQMASLYRARARLFLTIGQEEKAIAEAETAYRLEPENVENLTMYAETLVERNPAKTIDLLDDLVMSQRVQRPVIRPLARARLERGQYAQAEQVFLRRDEIDPDSCALCRELGETYEQIGLFGKAEITYRRLVDLRPENLAGLLGLARVLWREGKPPSESLAVLAAVPAERIARWPKEARVQLLAARSHYAILAGDVAGAAEHAKQAYELDPQHVLSRYHLVLTEALKGPIDIIRWSQLRGILDSLEFDQPRQPEILTLAGIAAIKANDLQTAMMQLQKAQKADPSYFHAALLLAGLYLDTHNYQAALGMIEQLRRYRSDYWDDHPDYNLFTDCFAYEDGFLKTWEQLDESKVDRDRKFVALGQAAMYLGRRRHAEEALNKVLQNAPNHLLANLYMARLYFEDGRVGEARRAVSKVLGQDRTHLEATQLFCRILEKQGERQDAMERLKRLIAVHGDASDARSLLSLMAYRHGQIDMAKEWARLAYQLDNHSLQAREARYWSRS